MMDIGAIIETAASVLTPPTPHPVKAGGKAADGAIAKLGEDAWTASKDVWAS